MHPELGPLASLLVCHGPENTSLNRAVSVAGSGEHLAFSEAGGCITQGVSSSVYLGQTRTSREGWECGVA